MPQQQQNTSNDNWLNTGLRNGWLGIVLSVGAAVVTNLWSSNTTNAETRVQLAEARERSTINAQNIQKNAETLNALAIAQAKQGDALVRVAEDIKALKEQQQRNSEMLMNRR